MLRHDVMWLQEAVRKMMGVTAGSLLAIELEYLSNQQIQLPALDRFDGLNEACAACKCATGIAC